VSTLSVIFRRFVLLSALAIASANAAANSVVLTRSAETIDAWRAVTVLYDPARTLDVEEVLARRATFLPPSGPHANLGVRRDAVWLRMLVHVPAGEPARWMLSVNYASLDRIEVCVIDGEIFSSPVVLGRALPFSQRVWPSSAHATPLDLKPGRDHEILLRVESDSSMVVPVEFSSPETFHLLEARTQVSQGMMAGVALCMLLYSLAQWTGLRDPVFLHYALTIAGIAVFLFAYFGLGAQHLWGDNTSFATRAAVAALLLGGVPGGFLFIDGALKVREIRPGIANALRAGAAMSGLIGGAFVADLVGYRAAQLSATLLGQLPMMLAIPVAWVRARRGERIGIYMLIGWGVYGLGTLAMAGLVRGYLPANYWTQHALQFGALVEMLMWLGVLGIRIDELRSSMQRAQAERDTLRAIAHTDSLTGLPNRRSLNERLARAVAECAPDRIAALYLLDLDGFKPANDHFGHDVGDELLIGVGRRLKALLRSSDIVARLGGDEFVVVATGVSGNTEARLLGQKLINAFREPFEAGGQRCSVGVTIGYAQAPLDGVDPQSLLKRADAAMYVGKQSGRNCLERGAASAGLAGA
jgi:diguanylate cyclase